LNSVDQYGSILVQKYTCEGCFKHFTLSSDPCSSEPFLSKKEKNTLLDECDVKSSTPTQLHTDASALVTKGLPLNNSLVWAALAMGLGFNQIKGFLAHLGIQTISRPSFTEAQCLIGKV